MFDYALRPEHEDLRWAARVAWFGDDEDAEIAEAEADEAELRLFIEWAWAAPDIGVEDLIDPDDEEGDCILSRFAADPAVGEELRRRARAWLEWERYGLWMLADAEPSPGVWLVDILTGTRIYGAIPDEQLEGLAPWSVLMGAVVPVDGVWRSGGAFLPLAPSTQTRWRETSWTAWVWSWRP